MVIAALQINVTTLVVLDVAVVLIVVITCYTNLLVLRENERDQKQSKNGSGPDFLFGPVFGSLTVASRAGQS